MQYPAASIRYRLLQTVIAWLLTAGVFLLMSAPIRAQTATGLPSVVYDERSVPMEGLAVAGSARDFKAGRFWVGTGAATVLDGVAMVGLSRLWYADYEQTAFHFHNDWDNWRQQDKLGHVLTAFHVARAGGAFAKWSGLGDRSAALYGSGVSLFFLTQIEVLDGFSTGWGASWPDFASNVVGAVAGGLQVAHPGWEVVTFKYAYHKSNYYDREVGWIGNAIKDYGGSSFWLVVRPAEVGGAMERRWPAWLGLSIGHGASGLERALPTPDSPHKRRIFVGPDLDILRCIRWPHRWMERVADVLSIVRIPAPALEVYPTVVFHPLYR